MAAWTCTNINGGREEQGLLEVLLWVAIPKAKGKLQLTKRKEVVGGSLRLQGQKADSPAQLKTPPLQKAQEGSSVML